MEREDSRRERVGRGRKGGGENEEYLIYRNVVSYHVVSVIHLSSLAVLHSENSLRRERPVYLRNLPAVTKHVNKLTD